MVLINQIDPVIRADEVTVKSNHYKLSVTNINFEIVAPFIGKWDGQFVPVKFACGFAITCIQCICRLCNVRLAVANSLVHVSIIQVVLSFLNNFCLNTHSIRQSSVDREISTQNPLTSNVDIVNLKISNWSLRF